VKVKVKKYQNRSFTDLEMHRSTIAIISDLKWLTKTKERIVFKFCLLYSFKLSINIIGM